MDEKKEIKVFPISFEVYAYDAQEVEDLRTAIVDFIGQHARCGRPVTAGKTAKAIREWDRNPIVRNKVIQYYQV